MAVALCVVLILSVSIHTSGGKLTFASYYGNHMVLQRSPEKAVLWGYGPESAQVTVSLSGPIKQRASAVTVTKGIWRVTLDPVEPGGPYNVTAATQSGNATLTDVLFGDIWLCGGQSNMFFQMSQVFNSSEELKLAAQYPHIRPFQVALRSSKTEQTDLIHVDKPWFVPTAKNMPGFSAVCWLFGRYMYDYLKYPIGLVESCWGGTPVEAWSSLRALQQCGLQESGPLKLEPSEYSLIDPPMDNSVLWNSMIHPLVNMTIKGALWYQGEANTKYHQEMYNCSFPAMIDDWRMAFHLGSGGQTAQDFPFGFVQLCTHIKNATTDSFPSIRWHQTADMGFVPNPRMQRTFMAVTIDLPDETSPYGTIHPRDKQDVAHRLTLGAKAVAYNVPDVPFLGPFPTEIQLTPNYISITYDQKVSITPSKDIFEICCSGVQAPCGNESHWVAGPITQWGPTTVQLSTQLCPLIDDVAGLRYAWRDWPCDFKACPVYSASRILPAPPFIVNRYAGKGN